MLPYGLKKFVRFATEVWRVDPAGKTDEQVAQEGLAALEAWMRKLGLPMTLRELNVTEDMLGDIANGVVVLTGGYKALTSEDVLEIFRESM